MKYLAQVVLYVSLIILVWKMIDTMDVVGNLTKTFVSFEAITKVIENAR